MAEKGEKCFSLSKGGKPSLPSTASLKGEDDSTARKKRERKVQFDSEDSLDGSKSNGMAHTPLSKGDGGRQGKGDKPTSVKSSKAKELELTIEKELPENTKCLMDCEAAEILRGIQDHMVVLSSDPVIKIPISFDRALMYAMRGSVYPNAKTARQILEPLKKYGVCDTEMCMISNIQVESADEVFALVPSLKGKKSKLTEPLKSVLDELAKLKSSV